MIGELIDGLVSEESAIREAAAQLTQDEELVYAARCEHHSTLSYIFALWLLQYMIPVWIFTLALGHRRTSYSQLNCAAVLLVSGLIYGAVSVAVTSRRVLLIRHGRIESEFPLAAINSLDIKNDWISQSLIINRKAARGNRDTLNLWIRDPELLAGAIQQAGLKGGGK